MIQRQFVMLENIAAVLTLIHVTQEHVTTTKLGRLLEVEVVFSNADAGNLHLKLFRVNHPVIVFFDDLNAIQEV